MKEKLSIHISTTQAESPLVEEEAKGREHSLSLGAGGRDAEVLLHEFYQIGVLVFPGSPPV